MSNGCVMWVKFDLIKSKLEHVCLIPDGLPPLDHVFRQVLEHMIVLLPKKHICEFMLSGVEYEFVIFY